MAVVIYNPNEKSRYHAPGLKPGDELSVSAQEAKRLIATGAFKAPKKSEPEPKPEPKRKKELDQ